MKKRSDKIRKVVSLAGAEERRCGAATGKSLQTLQDNRARLGELNAYRQNYATMSKNLDSVGSAQWQDYQTFMHKLDHAVQTQQQIVRDAEQAVEVHRQRWLVKRQRLESLQRVLEQHQLQELRHCDRLEQRRLDELPAGSSIFDAD